MIEFQIEMLQHMKANRKQYFNVTKTTLPIYNLTILDYMLVKDPITIRITNAFRIKVFDQLLPSLFSLT